MSTKHSKTAEKFQENKELAGWHDQTLWMMRAKRDKISREVPEWEPVARHGFCHQDVQQQSPGFAFAGV